MDAKRLVPTAQIRQFGFILAGILGALAGLQLWRDHRTAAWILGGAGLLSLVAAGLLPRALAPVHAGMVRIGALLGWVNTRIILILVFYLLVTPVGLVMRLFGHDPLHERKDRRGASGWIEKKADTRGRRRYEQMY